MNLFGISITYLAQNAGLDNDPSSMLFCGYFNTAAAVSTRANVPWRELTAERQQFWRYFTLQHKKTFNLKFFTLHLQAWLLLIAFVTCWISGSGCWAGHLASFVLACCLCRCLLYICLCEDCHYFVTCCTQHCTYGSITCFCQCD